MEVINSIVLEVYDPITKIYRIQKKIECSKIFNETTKSDDLSIFDKDINDIKTETTISTDFDSCCLYNIDTFRVLRNKIFVMTGIPPFRQHLLYSIGDNHHGIYFMSIFNNPVIINLVGALEETTDDVLLNLPIDREIYNNKGDINVRSLDTLYQISSRIEKFIVIDLFDMLPPTSDRINDLFIHEYMAELFYHGFIFKYYPMITYEIFLEIYKDKKDISFIYPILAPPIETLRRQYTLEKKLYSDILNDVKVTKDFLKSENYTVSRIVVSSPMPVLEVRSLFDIIELNSETLVVACNVSIGKDRYIVEKKHNLYFNDDIMLPRLHKDQLFIYTSNGSRILFTRDSCTAAVLMDDTQKYSHEKSREAAINTIKPYMSIIHKNSNIVIKSGTFDSLEFKIISSNIVLTYPEMVTTSAFMQLAKYFKCLEEILLVMVKSSKGGEHTLVTINGTVNRNDNVDYSYFYNINEYDRLVQSCSKIIRVVQRASDVAFQFNDFTDVEFNIMRTIFEVLMHTYTTTQQVEEQVESQSLKIVKRLKEIDPELFDLRRHDPESQVYAVKCQSNRQPVVYRENELKLLPDKVKNALVKFKNFTDGSTVFYHCPHPEFPALSFLPQSHPVGHCMPCCRQHIAGSESNAAKINCMCMQKYTLTKEELDNISGAASDMEHILNFGKFIPVGRKSTVYHQFVTEILKGKLNKGQMYLMSGVPQNLPGASRIGIIFSIADAFSMSIQDLIKQCTENLHKKITHMDSGAIKQFGTVDNFIDICINTFVLKNCNIYFNVEWADIFIPLVYLTYRIGVIVLNGMDAHLHKFIETKIKQDLKIRYCIVHSNKNGTYPIYLYEKNNIIQRLYDTENIIVKFIKKKISINKIQGAITIDDVVKFVVGHEEYSIENVLVGIRGYAYAVVLKIKNKLLYVPIAYSEYIKNVAVKYPDMEQFDRAEIHEFMKKLGRSFHITRNVMYDGKYVGVYYGKMLFHHKSMTNKDNDAEVIKIPYSFASINNALMNGIKVKFGDVDYYLYNNYLYRIFITEFANELRKNKNIQLRNKIIELIKAKNISKKQLHAALEQYPKDFEYIMRLLYSAEASVVVNKIKLEQFDFDNKIIEEMKNLKVVERIKYLHNLMDKHVDFTDKPVAINNMYLSCDVKQSNVPQPQCKDQKLMISKTNYEKCLELLANDIDRPIIRDTLSYMTLGRINPFKFTKRQQEDLIITII